MTSREDIEMKIGQVRDSRTRETLNIEFDPETDKCLVNGEETERLTALEDREGEVVLGIPDGTAHRIYHILKDDIKSLPDS
jgi:hypothetical protein